MIPNLQLLILESIGTQELILIGIIALIVFGPRKLPQMARKLGGMLTELRKVSNDFRETWEREASFDDSSFEDRKIEPGVSRDISRRGLRPTASEEEGLGETSSPGPQVREVSKEEFDKYSLPSKEDSTASMDPDQPSESTEDPSDDKRNWL
ncbi:MAG: twin-arginine translocase TatA/TatE family subunit [Acidobacteriota bacterium]|nr:MAG: twin-arginine translocase TatA/TatE family subunit [Acidobacteriota bacterium]